MGSGSYPFDFLKLSIYNSHTWKAAASAANLKYAESVHKFGSIVEFLMTKVSELKNRIEVALGNKKPDLVIKNAQFLNTLSGKLEAEKDIAVYKGVIVGIGTYNHGKKIYDAKGLITSPSFIDAHTHIESSYLNPTEYAQAVVPSGTGAVIADPHEIANVCGVEGIKYLIEGSKNLPLDIYFMVPSCVPASPWESAGAKIGPADIRELLQQGRVLGLGEMMNYPGLLAGDRNVLKKLEIASSCLIDGHLPSLWGKKLDAYIACGISTDHESTCIDEAEEKLSKGMKILIREGTTEKNLEELIPLVNNQNWPRFMMATDDRTASDLLKFGHIDHNLKKAMASGLEPITAFRLATLNPASHYSLPGLGQIAPGARCDLNILKELKNPKPQVVFYEGKMVAEKGRPLFGVEPVDDSSVRNTVNVGGFSGEDLKIPADYRDKLVIEVVPGQIVTRKSNLKPVIKNGEAVSDTQKDLLKLFLFERHKSTGKIGKGFVTGLKLKKGAIATSVAHDAHNILAVGVEDESIFTAVKQLEKMQGGLAVALNESILADLPLPLAGLLADLPYKEVDSRLRQVTEAARKLGSTLEDPFAVLSFLALSVIGEIRITDRGLLDVSEFKLF